MKGTGKLVLDLFLGAVPIIPWLISKLAFKKETILKHNLSVRSIAAIEVAGDGMQPNLKNGNTILLDHSKRNLMNSEIVVAQTEDGLIVKCLRKIEGNYWIPSSDNPACLFAESTDIFGRIVRPRV